MEPLKPLHPSTRQVHEAPVALKARRAATRPFNPYRQFNGVFIPEALLGMRAISPAAKPLYVQLLRRAGQDGNACPS